jgi:CRISPR-associated protein Cmr3
LYVEVDDYDAWPQKTGVLRIGGEGRGAWFEQIESAQASAWPALPDPLPDRFKVYFGTPTYFKNGWRPDDWNRFFDGPVELVAAAIPRYESLGGYDWAQNAHKPARRYVPAGSVYYFESEGAKRLKSGLVQNAITNSGAEIGFGQIIITEWKEN